MANDTGKYSLKHLFNRILNSNSDAIKVNINEIILKSGATLTVKDSNGFLVFSVDENGNVRHKGSLIKI